MPATYTVKQTAQLLGYSTNSIYTFLKEGRIRGVRVGKGRFRIPQAELDRILTVEGKVKVKPGVENLQDQIQAPIPGFSDKVAEELIEAKGLKGLKLIELFGAIVAILTGISVILYDVSGVMGGVGFESWLIYLKLGLAVLGAGLLVSGFSASGLRKIFAFGVGVGFALLAVPTIMQGEVQGGVLAGVLGVILVAAQIIDENYHLFGLYLGVAILSFPLGLGLEGADLVIVMTLWSVATIGYMGLVRWAAIRGSKLYWWLFIFLVFGLTMALIRQALVLNWLRSYASVALVVCVILWPIWRGINLLSKVERKAVMGLVGVIVVIFSVTLVSTAVTQRLVMAYATEQLLDKVAYARVLIDTKIENITALVQSLASSEVVVADLIEEDAVQLGDVARAILESGQPLKKVIFIDASGSAVLAYPYDPRLENADLSQREYFISAIEYGETVVGPFITSPLTGNEVLPISSPIGGERRIGVLAFNLDVIGVMNTVQQIANPVIGERVSLIESSGRIIYHPDPSTRGQILSGKRIALRGFEGEYGAGSEKLADGSMLLTAYAPVGGASKEDEWVVSISAPVEKILGMVSVQLAGVLGVVVFTGILTGYFVLRREMKLLMPYI